MLTTPAVEQIDLKLTIRFGKQIIKFPGGTVEFGLKRGELALRFWNGKMPMEKVQLKFDFLKALEVEDQREYGQELEGVIAVAPGVKIKDANKLSSKTKRSVSQVHNRGTEEQPVWEFQAHSSQDPPILLGQLTREHLGTVEMAGTPCSCTAIFTIRNQNDLYLFDASGLISGKNLSRNQLALIERKFFLRFIAPKLQPHLSQVEEVL
ncbi:hypothetical protein K9N68_05960 [Kovacikia minuta CCNUW1]|uniref:hypothetical protein n=1 Tax=Kovacikia minuta TaxID=2931930 RepID=UPI001CCBBC5B|nr:hypothetical protein [Kovacikia minuta]UBF27488.1 hypothetical protein K9N68_05960 [Kovacikia minuta CCNUW1]